MIYAITSTKTPMPLNSEQLINIYKKIIEPKLKDWVVFEHGTCVIIYQPTKNLETEAKEVLQKYCPIKPGTSSADFRVTKVDPGWIVTGDQPGILNYVTEDEGYGKEDYEIGLIGRNEKEQDSKELKAIYINT